MQKETSESSRGSGCLIRTFWMAIGNLVLILSSIGILQSHSGWSLTTLDVVFWLTVLSLPVARLIDIRYFHGQTADSRPATMADWQRYSASVVGIGFALWLGVHWLS